MGWFLSNKKKKPKSRRKASLTEQKAWDPQRTLAGLKVLGGFALAITLIIGWRYGERYLLNYTKDKHQGPVTIEMVELVDAPAWMSEGIRDQVRQTVSTQVNPDPMDGSSLRDAAKALKEDPWVHDVIQIARRNDGRVLVSAQYRQPVAIVESSDGYHLVDAEGVCLPGVYQGYEVNRLGFMMIQGVTSPPPASAGKIWPGEDVQVSLSLLRLLSEEPYVSNIKACDVSQRDERGRLRLFLHTTNGIIDWGLPPGQENAIEPDAKTKLDSLRDLVEGRTALSNGGTIYDISGPVPGERLQ